LKISFIISPQFFSPYNEILIKLKWKVDLLYLCELKLQLGLIMSHKAFVSISFKSNHCLKKTLLIKSYEDWNRCATKCFKVVSSFSVTMIIQIEFEKFLSRGILKCRLKDRRKTFLANKWIRCEKTLDQFSKRPKQHFREIVIFLFQTNF
jgi:hypothetical protein